jgi:hypothetical protein
MTNEKYGAAVRFSLLHSFLEVHNCVAPFTSHVKLHEFGAEKPISGGKPTHFDFSTLHFTVWSHILSTGGDALRYLPDQPFLTTYLPTYVACYYLPSCLVEGEKKF